MSGARERLSDATASAQDLGRTTADTAVSYGQQARRSLAEVLEREPLLLGAAGLLVGAAIGAALPATQAEDHALGPVRDKLPDKGKDLAQSGMQQSGHVAQTAYGAVKSEPQPSADGNGAPAERVESAVHAGAQAIRDELDARSN